MNKTIKNLAEKHPHLYVYLILFIFYSVSHVWILNLSNALFWDDWVVNDTSNEIIVKTSLMKGNPLDSIIHIIFGYLGYPIYRFSTFIIFFLNSILLDKILNRISFINDYYRFIICLLYVTTPLYIARVTIVCFPYTISLFLFLAAWFLIKKFRFFSLIIFFISFATNSLLVFYILPVAEIFYSSRRKNIFIFFRKNKFLLINPFLFFLLKTIFLPPYNLFENYNSNFALKNLVTAPILQINDALKVEMPLAFFVPIFVIFFIYIFEKSTLLNKQEEIHNTLKLFLFGILAFLSGVFPYWILNHSPNFDDFLSRHQLLMPLGVSLIITAVLTRFKIESQKILLSLCITIFLLINFSNYVSLTKDFNKQKYLINQFSTEKIIENSDIVLFRDETKNALNRKYRHYEWKGLLKKAYPKKEILGLNEFNYNKEFMSIDDLINSNCQMYYGIKRTSIPQEINVSIVKISNKKEVDTNSFIRKIFSKIKNFGSSKINITIIKNYTIEKNKFSQINNTDYIKCQIK